MFDLLPTEIPYRRKNCFRHMRHLARRNAALGVGQFNDTWMPMPASIMGRAFLNNSVPEIPNRFEGLVDYPSSRSMLSGDLAYGRHYVDEPTRRDHPDHYHNTVMPFERAAAALSNTLDSAIKFCKDIENQFEDETLHVAIWANPKCIDSLWTMKLNWNGLPAFQEAKIRNMPPPSTIVTYNKVVKALRRAVHELQMSEGPHNSPLSELGRSHESPERVRTTFKKLLVTFQGIEELMESVRTHRERMKGLDKELASAQSMLRDIRDFWTPRRRAEERSEEHQFEK